jgi:RHS repeat-associated protein
MSEENNQLYYYHGDHLGSAQLVTDPEGEIYEQLEYTPYGELWVEYLKTTIEATPFRFTGKERDGEAGLYYFGARYLNPQTGMWLSADPAMGEYIPQALINDETKKYNQNLPGMGGVFNYVNLHAYHYAGNNPVKLVDSDGRGLDDFLRYQQEQQQRIDDIQSGRIGTFTQTQWKTHLGFGSNFAKTACAATSLLNTVAHAYTLETGEVMTLEMGSNLLKSAIAAGGIYESTGGIRRWDTALGAMAKEAGIKGQITYVDSGAGATWQIYSLFRGSEYNPATGKNEELTHFVNYSGNGNYFDVWNSKIENLTTNGRRTTIDRPIRGINYTPPGRVYDGGMH